MKTIIIYVTFRANIEVLIESINSIKYQVDKLIIVDNTPGKDLKLEIFKAKKIEIIHLEDNFGIAYAQNIGIKKALDEDFNYIVLSDQDTIYPNNYIEEMIKVFEFDEKVCAVAPKYFDKIKRTYDGFIAVKPIVFKQFFPESGKHEIMQAIASGTIIQAKYLKYIGLMKEDLFIDWVDLEWCWRATKKGYKIIGNADVVINHSLGDTSIYVGSKKINLRSPIRHYYIIRNGVYLAIYSRDLDFMHRTVLFLKSFKYIVGYPLLAMPHIKNLKYVLIGFFHGITKRLGKYEG